MKRKLFLSIFLLSACGKSKLTQDFIDAATLQENLEQGMMPVWERSPTIDANNPNLTAAQNLCDIVPKGRMPVGTIQGNNDPLRAPDLIVYKSLLEKTVKSFFDYLSSKDDCFSDDYQIPHSFVHTRKALDYLGNVFVATNNFPGVVVTSQSKPLTLYANEESSVLRERWDSAISKKNSGNSSDYNSLFQQLGSTQDAYASVFSTHYDTLLKSMRFYRDGEGDLQNFNAGQEADAIYHEACHHFQNTIHSNYLQQSVSDASGALLEGLADFCAATILRDDNILSYFKANAPTLFGAANWNGPNHQRSLRNSLKFPANYVGEIHLDGRIVASALNDYRKFLAGERIQLLSSTCGSSCGRVLGSRAALSQADAWDAVLRLSHIALFNSQPTDSLTRYASILKDELQNHCSTRYSNFCNTETKSVLLEIFNGRGIAPVALGNAFQVTEADIQVDNNLGILRYPVSGRSGYNDASVVAKDLNASVTTKDVGRCEVLMVFPVIKNISHTRSRQFSIVNGSIKFSSVQISSSNVNNSQIYNYFIDPSDKIVPWLEPSEDSGSMILSRPRYPVVSGASVSFVNRSPSRIYSDSFGSVLTQQFSADFNQSPVGWTIVAPPNVGDTMTIKFKLKLTPFQSSVAYDKTTSLPTSTVDYTRVITVNSSKSYPCL